MGGNSRFCIFHVAGQLNSVESGRVEIDWLFWRSNRGDGGDLLLDRLKLSIPDPIFDMATFRFRSFCCKSKNDQCIRHICEYIVSVPQTCTSPTKSSTAQCWMPTAGRTTCRTRRYLRGCWRSIWSGRVPTDDGRRGERRLFAAIT